MSTGGSRTLELREILGPRYPECCFWLDLLQRQFPISEQVPAESVLSQWQSKERGECPTSHFYTAHEQVTGEPVGMAWYESYLAAEAAALWYLAVAPGREGGGLGSDILRKILALAFAENNLFVILEVETAARPDSAGEEANEAKLRQIDQRNRFYMRRHGALQLTGIHYMQRVGDQPAIPMDLLVLFNPGFTPLSAEETLTRAKLVFGTSLVQTGKPALSRALPALL